MEILVDDGSGFDDGCGADDDDDDAAAVGTVEAGTLGTVVASDTLFDANLSDANGCDPAGCTASLTRVSRFTRVKMSKSCLRMRRITTRVREMYLSYVHMICTACDQLVCIASEDFCERTVFPPGSQEMYICIMICLLEKAK